MGPSCGCSDHMQSKIRAFWGNVVILATIPTSIIAGQLVFLSSMGVSTPGVISATIPATSPPKSATTPTFKLIHLIQKVGIGNG